METLLFWALPALLVLTGLKGRLMTGWRLCFCGGWALYLGVWLTPAWYTLLDFLPPGIEVFRIGGAVLAGTLAIFFALLKSTLALTQRDSDEFSFPKVPEWVLNAVCRMCFGIFLSTLIFMCCVATPVRTKLRNCGDGFEKQAEAALLRITAFGDALTFFTPSKPRSEMLAEFWYVPPEKKAAAAKTGEKAPAPSAAGESSPAPTAR